MSIRKVFGADAVRILISLSVEFLKPVILAMIFTLPITFLIAKLALSHIPYRVPFSWWMFGSGTLIIILIAAVIVFYHGWRSARENPVVRLRNE